MLDVQLKVKNVYKSHNQYYESNLLESFAARFLTGTKDAVDLPSLS